MKKAFLLTIILLSLCASIFAVSSKNSTAKSNDKYNISVKQADNLQVDDKIVILTGNVVLSLKTTSDNASTNKDRELRAQKIVFNLDKKLLQASGDVHLKEDSSTSFDGDAISLNWENLDVVVFGGGSSSNKKNNQGTNVNLHTRGGRVSYEGDTKTVFFEKGVVSTRAKDPFWSIRASQIGMSNSDLFLKNATFRIGRVPFFWLPFFYYPGVQLAINPAMGISSDKGMFLNTTYELYGKYPKLGASGSSSSSSSSESSSTEEGAQAALAIFSMIASGENEETVRDGLYYKPVKEVGEQSKTQAWAKKTGSYMALFGDAYEHKGISVGFDTKNKTEDGTMKLDATGVLGFRYNNLEYKYYEKFRYALEMNLALNIDRTSLKLVAPFYSDPMVKKDFLNRNSAFGLDAMFGQEQSFHTMYSSSDEEYKIALSGNSNHTKNGFSLNITNIDSYVKYKWKPGTVSNGSKTKDAFVYEITEAKLPSFTIGSSGTLYDYKKDGRTVENYQSALAEEFAEALSEMPKNTKESAEYKDSGLAAVQTAPSFKSTRDISGANLKISYTYSQTLNNFYTKNMKHSYLATSINPNIRIEGGSSNNFFNFTETINPIYSGTLKDGDFSNSNFTLRSTLAAKFPALGITYNLSANTLIYTNRNAERDFRVGKWDNKDILSHNLSFSKSYKWFTFGLSQTFKPLTESFSPSVAYSAKGVNVKVGSSFGFNAGRGHFMDATSSYANISYSNNFLNTSFNNNLNHTLNNLEGYTSSHSLTVYPLYMLKKNKKLYFSESLSLQKEFEPKSLSVSANYDGNYVLMTFKNKELEKDYLKLHLKYNLVPKYWWRNRIGLESSLDTNFTYDFNNEYGSSFDINFTMGFEINKFIKMALNVGSQNNSFHFYYDNDKKFQFDKLWEDLIKSFDFFGDGRKSTHFVLNTLGVSFTHYLEDWDVIMNASGKVETVNGKRQFKPEISVSVKWRAIPELKLESKYNDETKEWEKK